MGNSMIKTLCCQCDERATAIVRYYDNEKIYMQGAYCDKHKEKVVTLGAEQRFSVEVDYDI